MKTLIVAFVTATLLLTAAPSADAKDSQWSKHHVARDSQWS